ncbi:MAG TPA: TonB-dependent receptor [Steroidobacteraceae bacterium]|nr:TonB-dependent receptor [Steroidobacteraceae bacterium]
MIPRSPKTIALLGWAAALGPAAAVAADAPASRDPEEVLVVGQRDAPITVVPRGLSVSLGERQFEAINVQNVEDLMKYAPDFYVRKRFAGDDNAVVALRGTNTVQSARTLVMVDGFVVSNFLGNSYGFPPKWNVVGPAEVQQFDVVYGPYSARYGGNSMGGIVSVTTREPTRTGGYLALQSFAMPFEEYGVDETFEGYSVEAGGTWKATSSPWSLRVGARHFDNVGQSMTYHLLTPAAGTGTPVQGAFDDPRLAAPVFGAASPVHVTQDQLRLRLGYAGERWKLDGLLFGWLTRQDLTDARSFLTDADGDPVYQGRVDFDGVTYDATGLVLARVERREYLAGIKATGQVARWDATVNLSHYWIGSQDTRTSRDHASGVADGPGTISLLDEPGWWTLDAGLERRFAHHRLAFGINANLYQTRQDNFATTDWRRASSPVFSSATFGSTRTTGIYAEDEISLGTRSSLTLGGRFDRWEAHDGGMGQGLPGAVVFDTYPRRHDGAFSPKLSLRSTLGADWNLQLSLGEATRFPTVGELFQGRFDDITRTIDPQSFDPHLRAEHSRDANLILRRHFGKVSLTSSLFYQDIDDAIFSFSGLNQFGTVVSSFKNIDRVRQFGLELMVEARELFIDGLDVDFSVVRLDARTVRNEANPAAEDQKFPRIPDWRANGNLRYRMPSGLTASLGWRYASRPNSDLFGLVRGDAYGYQSEYFFVDTRVSWDVNESMQMSLGVDNLTDAQAYVSHPLPQRTGFAEVRMKF